MLFHIFRHINPHHRVFIVEEKLGEGASQFGFADTRRAEKDERADGPLGIAQSSTRAADGARYAFKGGILTDNSLP